MPEAIKGPSHHGELTTTGGVGAGWCAKLGTLHSKATASTISFLISPPFRFVPV